MFRRLIPILSIAAIFAATTALHSIAQTQTLVTEPDQGLTSIYNLLQSATKTIDMTMNELVDTQAEQILAQQAVSGVTVRVILDQNLEKSNNQAAFTYLSNNGVNVVWAPTKYHATHQKSIVIDGKTVAIMTLNLTSRYYSDTRDFAVIEADASDIAAIEKTFNADFTGATITPATGDDLVWSPTNSTTVLVDLINSAKYTLNIENEEMSNSKIITALENAAQNGVQVHVTMTNGGSYTKQFNALVAAGVQVNTYTESAPLYIHAKIIVVDFGHSGQQAFVGSENFSVASLTENRELGLTTTNSTILSSLNNTLDNDFQGATPWSN